MVAVGENSIVGPPADLLVDRALILRFAQSSTHSGVRVGRRVRYNAGGTTEPGAIVMHDARTDSREGRGTPADCYGGHRASKVWVTSSVQARVEHRGAIS